MRAAALVMIFMLDAGWNSLPAFFEYSVSPVRGFTISTPHCAFLNSGCVVSESTRCRSSARGEAGRIVLVIVTHAVRMNGVRAVTRARAILRVEWADTVFCYSLL